MLQNLDQEDKLNLTLFNHLKSINEGEIECNELVLNPDIQVSKKCEKLCLMYLERCVSNKWLNCLQWEDHSEYEQLAYNL